MHRTGLCYSSLEFLVCSQADDLMPKFYWTVRCTPTPLAPPVYCFETSGSYTSFSFTTPIGKVMNVSGIRVCSQVTRIRIQIRHHTDTNHPTYILTRHIWQETVILQYKPTIGTLSYNDDGVSIVRLQFIDDPGGKLLGRGVVVKERLGLGGSCCRRSSSIIVAGAGAVVVEPY